MPIMLSGQPGLPYNWTPRPDVGFGIGGLYGGAPYGIPKRRKPQAGFGLGELPWPLNLVAAGLMPLAKALGLSQPSATPQAMPPYRSPAATGGIAGGGIPMTRRFAGNEPQTPAYAQMWNRGTANRALAAASGTSPLTGPFSATRRYGTGGLAYALSQAGLEGGAPMQLVQRKARPGMAAGGYGYQMPASARQMRPSPVQMAAMLESGQPLPPGFAQPPATPLPRRHGRIAAPAPEEFPLPPSQMQPPGLRPLLPPRGQPTQPETPQWQDQPWGAIPAEFQGFDPAELRRYWEMFAGQGRQPRPNPFVSSTASFMRGPTPVRIPPSPDAFWKWLWGRRESERTRREAQTKMLGTPAPSWFEAGDIPYQTAETLPDLERSFVEWYRHRNPSLGRLGEKPPTQQDWQEFLQGRAEGMPLQHYRPSRPLPWGARA